MKSECSFCRDMSARACPKCNPQPIDTSTLGPIKIAPPSLHDWRLPYRSMDAGGSTDSAGQVGWDFIYQVSRAEHGRDPRGLELDNPRMGSDGGTIALYRDCKLIAAAFVFRDPMNFAVLVRWKAEGVL